MTDLVMTGLDGANPLGFLAALGVLDVLDGHAEPLDTEPVLGWRDTGGWRPFVPCLGRPGGREALVEAILTDRDQWRDEPALLLKYVKAKNVEGGPRRKDSEAWDLKPPPGRFREYLRGLVEGCRPEHRGGVDLAAAFATDVVRDRSGNTKPTALHFTAGQQEFLTMVDELLRNIDAGDIEEALFGPWRYARPLPVLQWDATAAREYAFRASDPSKEKKLGVPGADWLAFRGLRFIRVAAVTASRIATTGCAGGWKTGSFRWPLWTVPLTSVAARTALTLERLEKIDEATRRARGIGIAFQAEIRRSDQGGYGSFSPAAVI